MRIPSRLLEHPGVYRLWQMPFAERKLAPVLRHNDLSLVRRVLDVACGPGTNARFFGHAEYLGIDIDERYVAYASRRYPGTFRVADATALPPVEGRFDFILVNSFLHHVETTQVLDVLHGLADLLTADGHVHVVDLVLPQRASPARWLAERDRGAHALPLEEWRTLMTRRFEEVVFEPFPIRALGVTLWNLCYFKGRRPDMRV